MSKKPEIKMVAIPEELIKVALKRIEPYVDDYHRHQLLQLKTTGLKNDFDLKALLLSVYIQGVSDGQQLPSE